MIDSNAKLRSIQMPFCSYSGKTQTEWQVQVVKMISPVISVYES